MTFNWKFPDYSTVYAERARRLAWMRALEIEDKAARAVVYAERVAGMRAFYRDHEAQFIDDWGMTYDPRNAERGLPVGVPFKLFPRQWEWCAWLLQRWRASESGATVKSRDAGVTWLAVAMSCTLCLFNDDLVIGFGSRKLELVDKLGDPDCIFWKAREFLAGLPPEFLGGWSRADAPEKLIKFPGTGSAIKGEGGDDIGRGGRSAIYFVDESAALIHPASAEASLSQTTNCRIDISTPRGQTNPFFVKVTTWPERKVFRFHWRDDPRKGDEWYARQVAELDNPVVVAQEIDMDFAASIEGVLIPSSWVQASVGAARKLGIKVTGSRTLSLDVADEGVDKNAVATGKGIEVDHLEEWTGKNSDIFATVIRTLGLCDQFELDWFLYDADGLGAGVRGDTRVANEKRKEDHRPQVTANPFRGSGEVLRPDAQDEPGRKNKDFFQNRKAQEYWALRKRFQRTFRAVVEGVSFDPDEIISISEAIPATMRNRLVMELSQPTYVLNTAGKMVVNKKPDNTKSPNLSDAVMIWSASRRHVPMRISKGALNSV